jgi:hypothetical protein
MYTVSQFTIEERRPQMAKMDIIDLHFKELLSSQELETLVGGTQSLLSNEIIKKPLVTLEAVSPSVNDTTIAKEISVLAALDDLDSRTMGLGPRGPLPGPGPGPGPSGHNSLQNVI